MAKHCVVSTIGSPQLRVIDDRSPAQSVSRAQVHWQELIGGVLPDQPDLIVLPENCDMYSGLDPAEARVYLKARGDAIRDDLAAIAREHQTHIAYSSRRLMADGSCRNSTQLIGPDGCLGTYDKNYVVDSETHDHGILCGNELCITDTRLGRIAFVICFDLNFDELRLRVKAAKPDIILFSSAYHGGLMQPYWAYSCRAHFVSAVFGTHPSQILSPLGEVIASTTNYTHHVTATINTDCALIHLDYHEEKLTALKAAYGRGVTIHDPGYLGSVLVTCNRDDRTIHDLIEEFQLQPLDAYFQAATTHRLNHLAPALSTR